ncbi:response regulator [Planctellipticum variicoloris]|uniref:response regulator n=1 Tax=Planctellipticum variicoloris TaxID=3064265 RepID=UPI002B9A6289|nr:response regulator [Planctomycetaceae bacterium SH412]HTN01770.1 response regulator [Planctomycetaceae bacterium]
MHHNLVGRPMEILLVEDSLMFARIAIGALRKAPVHHRLTWLSDGGEALEFLYQRGRYARVPEPDLVLLDLSLPGCDGREILAQLRADDSHRHIPVVIMTASTSASDRAAVEQLDVQGYLTKPLNLDEFVGLIQQLSNLWKEDLIVPGAR